MKGFFQDENGNRSMMRLLAFLAVASAILWGSVEIVLNFINSKYDIHETLILSFAGFGFTAKWAQHRDETNKTKEK